MRLCTTNPGKVAEFAGLLAPLGISLVPTMIHDVPETGSTFSDNGREKAFAYSKLYPGEWILSEDSGLVVPALGGLPGPWSARYDDVVSFREGHAICLESFRSRSEIDVANNEKLLREMKNVPENRRGAYLVSHLVVIHPKSHIAFDVERRAYGWVTLESRGTNGFGYDPVFMSEMSFGKTWAEIDTIRKELISHRSKVSWDFLAWVCSTEESVC